jgi:hypothetical protein
VTEPTPPSTRINQREVDGLTSFHIDGTGVTTATLHFRVGLVDEDFVGTGVAHLVEHLVMHQLPRPVAVVNAGVMAEHTEFWIRGSAGAVTDFVTRVCAAISALREEVDAVALEHEAGVLLAESTGSSPAAVPVSERYGLTGPGLLGVSPVAVPGITAERVRDWVRRYFVRENAVLTVLGPWPEGLSAPLPSGKRNVRADAVPLGFATPAQRVDEIPFVALGLLVPRGDGNAVVERLLADRLHEHLRTTLGTSYSVGTDSVDVSPDLRHLAVIVDSAPGKERQVAVEALAELRRLATDGPSQADLDHDTATFEELLLDPEFGAALLANAAYRHLDGREQVVSDARDLVARMRATTTAQVREVIASSLDSLVVVHPGPEPLTSAETGDRLLLEVPPCTTGPITGTSLSRKLWKGAPRGARLLFNDEAAALVFEDQWHAIRYDDVIGLGHHEDVRRLVSRTGCSFWVTPDEFKGTAALVSLLDQRIDPSLRFVLEPGDS